MTSHKIIKEPFYNWALSSSQVSLVFQILTPLPYHSPTCLCQPYIQKQELKISILPRCMFYQASAFTENA